MSSSLVELHRFVVDHYDLEELRSLCFELGVDYDSLRGEGKANRARELVLWMGRRRQFDALLSALQRTRSEPFDQAGLSSEPAALEALYAALPEFEAGGEQSWWQRLRRRPRLLYPTLIAGFLILVAVLVWANVGGAKGWLQDRRLLPGAFPAAGKDEVLIVVARFHLSAGMPDAEIHNEIRWKIEEAAQELGFSHLRVGLEPTRLSVDDQTSAKRLGKRYKASMVIWGADTGVRVTVRYLNLKQPSFEAAEVTISETERTRLAAPSAYTEFVTEDLPGQLTFLSLFAVGRSYYLEGSYGYSIRAIEKAVSSLVTETVPLEGEAEAYFYLGWLYQATDDDERAIVNYTQAIALNPDYDQAFYNRGIARYDQGDLAGAIADYDRAIELDPSFALAYTGRGVARADQGDQAGAIADYTHVIELDPDNDLAYYDRAVARQAQGDLEGSIADYERASQLSPDPAAAYNGLCWVYSLKQQPELALPYCQQAIELNPHPGFLDSRGLAYALLGDYPAAIADFQVYMAWLDQQPEAKWQAGLARRQAWVEALEAGQNPFTPEVLQELRNEWQP